jgi:hypothetical protein
MEVYVDDETKLTLHGLQQYYVKLRDNEKNRKLFDLLDLLEFNQVRWCFIVKREVLPTWLNLWLGFYIGNNLCKVHTKMYGIGTVVG